MATLSDQRSAEAQAYRSWYAWKTWQMLRRQQLRIEPLCRMCDQERRTTPANTIDHIKPHKGDWQLFIDPSNLQSLCQLHHSATKQNVERRGFDVAVDDRGFPLDPKHPGNR